MTFNLKTCLNDEGRRLDRILRKSFKKLPLSLIHSLIRKGKVYVNGKKASANYLVRVDELITVDIESYDNLNELSIETKKSLSSLPPLSIIYEGEGLLILNKAAGLIVHGRDSLEEMVLSYLTPKLPPSLSFKPGPLHRLDKTSSGLIVFSASLEGARTFSCLLRERKIKKYYLALVEGEVRGESIWQDEIGRNRKTKISFTEKHKSNVKQTKPAVIASKTALSRIKPLAANKDISLILAEIETGRTHQIRVQAMSHGHPLIGDTKYGGKRLNESGFFLHAWRMEIPGLPALMEAPLPPMFQKKIYDIFGKTSKNTF